MEMACSNGLIRGMPGTGPPFWTCLSFIVLRESVADEVPAENLVAGVQAPAPASLKQNGLHPEVRLCSPRPEHRKLLGLHEVFKNEASPGVLSLVRRPRRPGRSIRKPSIHLNLPGFADGIRRPFCW